jgi:hypothetical protein
MKTCFSKLKSRIPFVEVQRGRLVSLSHLDTFPIKLPHFSLTMTWNKREIEFFWHRCVIVWKIVDEREFFVLRKHSSGKEHPFTMGHNQTLSFVQLDWCCCKFQFFLEVDRVVCEDLHTLQKNSLSSQKEIYYVVSQNPTQIQKLHALWEKERFLLWRERDFTDSSPSAQNEVRSKEEAEWLSKSPSLIALSWFLDNIPKIKRVWIASISY